MNGEKNYTVKGFAETIKKRGKILCEECSVEDIYVLQVHHLDENRKNNSPDNLKTLCANCHCRTHWGNSQKRERDISIAIRLADSKS
jgi:predicted HNH restriction endonuclease